MVTLVEQMLELYKRQAAKSQSDHALYQRRSCANGQRRPRRATLPLC